MFNVWKNCNLVRNSAENTFFNKKMFFAYYVELFTILAQFLIGKQYFSIFFKFFDQLCTFYPGNLLKIHRNPWKA